MTGCGCEPSTVKFDEAYAAEKLERYRTRGPDASTRALLEAIVAEGVRGLTLLDIGGGVGVLQHELIDRGLESVQEVEASAAYSAACAQEARARGHGGRIRHLVGDFSSVARAVSPADIVTLDRSVCCWSEPLKLIEDTSRMALRLYGLVYPRDTWWVRYGWRWWGNLKQVVKRSGLRLATPRAAEIEAILAREGLWARHRATSGVWQVALFTKAAPAG